jgi:hypothetical protein
LAFVAIPLTYPRQLFVPVAGANRKLRRPEKGAIKTSSSRPLGTRARPETDARQSFDPATPQRPVTYLSQEFFALGIEGGWRTLERVDIARRVMQPGRVGKFFKVLQQNDSGDSGVVESRGRRTPSRKLLDRTRQSGKKILDPRGCSTQVLTRRSNSQSQVSLSRGEQLVHPRVSEKIRKVQDGAENF